MPSFTDLPNEIFEMIAEKLDDGDLARFSQTCRKVSEALDVEGVFWRRLFIQTFDEPPSLTSGEMGRRYRAFTQHLRLSQRRGDHLHLGEAAGERRQLITLKLMIREALAGTSEQGEQGHSKNLELLSTFCRKSSLYLDFCKSTRPLIETQADLLVVQVMLVHELFNNPPNEQEYGVPPSQYVVYASALQEPMLLGRGKHTVNLKFLRSAINVMYSALIFSELRLQLFQDEDFATTWSRIPRPWTEQLRPGVTKIGKNWIGLHAAAENMVQLLAMRHNHPWENDFDAMDVIPPAFDGLQFVYIDRVPANYPLRDEIERHLKCADHPSQRYWEWLAGNLGILAPHNQTEREGWHENLASKVYENMRGRQSAPWVREYLVDLDLETRTNPDDQDNIETGQIMFKCATGRPNLGNRQNPVQDQRIGVGFLQALPAQRGIPGWQRFSMLTFSFDTAGAPGGETAYKRIMSETDHHLFWELLNCDVAAVEDADSPTGMQLVDDAFIYEGVVLPGGQVTLGRWWQVDPQDPDSMEIEACVQPSGPFMFWRIHDDDISVPQLMPEGFGPPRAV